MIAGQLSLLAAAMTATQRLGDTAFSGMTTDSRNIVPGQLFIAIRGENFDGHQFLQQAIDLGAAAVVTEVLPAGFNAPALVVPDTRLALAEISRWWRRHFQIPVIGVTGSNGKTTVKEMIATVLSHHFGEQHRLATAGNLNNEIGVPLTIARLSAAHQAAVIEMGMNHPGEIAGLACAAEPSIALVNNAQREHQEFMHTVEAVALENGAVLSSLPPNGIAVFPADDEFTSLWAGLAGQRQCVTFGFHAGADVSATCQSVPEGSQIKLTYKNLSADFFLGAFGLHNVRNAMAAAACCLAAGLSLQQIAAGLSEFKPVKGRLQRHQTASGTVVIDDTYNANPDSVRAAIDVLRDCVNPVLVLGDMGEVGNNGPEFHHEIGLYASQAGVQHLFLLGDAVKDTASGFGPAARHFTSVEALNSVLKNMTSGQSTVLVKGSRFMKMERVVQYLLEQSP